MWKYITQRILLMFMTLFIITGICFVLIRMLPLPPLPAEDPHSVIVEMQREAAGYNKPYMVQFGIFLKNIFTKFDWGVSDKLYIGRDVANIFLDKLPATMIVNIYSILFSIPIGILFGIFAALKKNTWIDHSISTLTMVVISVPSFVYAFIIQYVFYYKLNLLPPLMNAGKDFFTWSMFKSMLPPVMSLSFGVIAGFTRTTRAELTEVLTSEFMLLARTKGLTKTQATVRHALKNCMVVVLPSIFGQFIGILGGAMILEQLYGIPGIGKLFILALNYKDYDLLFVDMAIFTTLGLLAGILLDLSYGFIDPRIRMGAKK